MKIIKDLKEKDCLEEDVYQLFNQWNQMPTYKVNDNWINKEQIQLYIDVAQSYLKLTVIPELARFFFKHNSPIPFQIFNHKYAIIQHIIIGKQFYLRHPDKLNDQLKFWNELKSSDIIKILVFEDRFGCKTSTKLLTLSICEINKKMIEILENKTNQNKLFKELDNQIDQFIQLINCHLYQNILRRKQLFYTLQSLFIKDEIIIPIIIKKIKNSIDFHEIDTDAKQEIFLLPSLKKNFEIKDYIIVEKNQKEKEITYFGAQGDFVNIFYEFKNARDELKEREMELNQILELFKNIIHKHEFLNKPKYRVFKLNVEIYIKQIELEIEIEIDLHKKEIKENKIQTIFVEKIAESQFLIEKVEMNSSVVVRKKMSKKEQKQQIINECSILSQLQKYQKHKNVIRLIDYSINNGEIELYLEYCEKGSLRSFLTNNTLTNNTLTKQQKISICVDILEGVEYLHENKILHGDLKLDNIVMDSNNIIKIIDFGSCAQLVEQCQYYTRGYKSDDKQQSLFYDYFSIGIILFSVLLQDTSFSKNYSHFKYGKIQNKKLLKKYFDQKKKEQKEEIEKEYSSSLFKAILSLFNDQPYLRPKLSELIDIFNSHKYTPHKIQTFGQVKYSIKQAIINLKDKQEDSQLNQLMIKYFFEQDKQKDTNQQHESNQNNKPNSQECEENQDKDSTQEKENTINRKQKCVQKNKNQDQNKKERQQNKQQSEQKQSSNKQNIYQNEIKDSKQNNVEDSYQTLIEYFTKQIDEEQRYQFKPLQNIKDIHLKIKKLQLDIFGLTMMRPQERAKYLLYDILLNKMNKENIDDILAIAEGLENEKVNKYIKVFNSMRTKDNIDECINLLKVSLLFFKANFQSEKQELINKTRQHQSLKYNLNCILLYK